MVDIQDFHSNRETYVLLFAVGADQSLISVCMDMIVLVIRYRLTLAHFAFEAGVPTRTYRRLYCVITQIYQSAAPHRCWHTSLPLALELDTTGPSSIIELSNCRGLSAVEADAEVGHFDASPLPEVQPRACCSQIYTATPSAGSCDECGHSISFPLIYPGIWGGGVATVLFIQPEHFYYLT